MKESKPSKPDAKRINKKLEPSLRAAIQVLEENRHRYEENIIERAVLRDLGGWSAWICSPEDLPDVENLLAVQRGKLDCAYIHEWLAQFADALEKPEILSEYERLRAASNKRR